MKEMFSWMLLMLYEFVDRLYKIESLKITDSHTLVQKQNTYCEKKKQPSDTLYQNLNLVKWKIEISSCMSETFVQRRPLDSSWAKHSMFS